MSIFGEGGGSKNLDVTFPIPQKRWSDGGFKFQLYS